ncbi:MAG: tetratricopeptide (TPR) repeat protein [Verrucomicrobiales bacterium]
MRKELIRRDPNNTEYLDALEGALRNMGWLHRRTGEFDLALESYSSLEKLNHDRIERTAKVPSEKEFARNGLAATLTIKATILLGAGRVDEAHNACEEGTKIRSQLAASRPDSHISREDLAFTLLRLADIEATRGSFDQAREHLDEAVELRAARAATNTTHLDRQHKLAVAQCRRGKFLRDRKHYAEAMIDVRQAMESWERLLREAEDSAKWNHAHAEGVILQLDLAALGQDEEFLAKCESALVSIANLPGLEASLMKAQAHAGLAKCYAKQGNDAWAREQQGVAQSLIDEVLSTQPNRVTAHTIDRWCKEQEWTPINWLFCDF